MAHTPAVSVAIHEGGPVMLPIPPHLQAGSDARRSVAVANSLGATNDHEAILTWLNARAKNVQTRKAYLQEIRRFLAFMLYIRGRLISNATVGDLEAFRVWLVAPYLPAEGWPAGYMPFGKGSEAPAADGQVRLKGLATGSRRRADTTIRGFFRFLHDSGYLATNPCLRLGKLTGEEISQDALEELQLSPEMYARQRRLDAIEQDNRGADKAFSIELWLWLRDFLDAPENQWRIADPDAGEGAAAASRPQPWPPERQERLRCILMFGYAAAGRRAEIAETTMSAIVQSGKRWIWKVIGKGRTAADGPDRVTLDDAAVQALMRYRAARGLSGYPDASERQVPLIAKLTPQRRRSKQPLKTGEGVTAGYLNSELRRFLNYAAPFAAMREPAWEAQLRRAASHWLRHTRGTHFALGHVSLARTAEQLRHKDPRTTSKYYVHMKDEERGEAVDAISTLLKSKGESGEK
ncbi:site-specific integrase [Zoogloea sp.]|uniref:tyrosine-type recombinase/integrase n=1 Tax=Zoogloea sp. TaxID=49181 RepID=UPI0026098FE9|nr:site-specific integrase [Zoogloea sp.]